MIKQNKIKAIVSSVLILLPALFALIFWKHLNALMLERFLGKGTHGMLFMTLFMPCLLLALHWLMLIVTAIDYRKNPQHHKLTRIIFFIVPVIALFVGSLFFAIILDWQLRIQWICSVVIGISMLLIGNYIPKSKPNHTMGPRTRWALSNEENWRATCRFSGKIMVGVGVLFLFTGFLPLPAFIPVLFALIIPVAIAPIVYSYRFYKKQLADGKCEKQDLKMEKSTKTGIMISAVSIPLVLILCTVLLFTGNIKVSFHEAALEITADYYDDLSLDYTDIAAITFVENDSATRQYGYGSMRLDMGVYHNDSLGTHTRYAYHNCHAAVVITTNNGQILVLNGVDEAATKQIYSALLEKVGE